MNKEAAVKYLKDYKFFFHTLTNPRNIYFHVDNYHHPASFFDFENISYSYYEIQRHYYDDNLRLTSLNNIFSEIVNKLPKEERIANIISIRHIYSFNGTNIIALALATKRLK